MITLFYGNNYCMEKVSNLILEEAWNNYNYAKYM